MGNPQPNFIVEGTIKDLMPFGKKKEYIRINTVSYTHLRAHETVLDLVCRLLLEKKQTKHNTYRHPTIQTSIILAISVCI